MSYAYAKELDSKKIPIIDIASLRDGSNKISVAKNYIKPTRILVFSIFQIMEYLIKLSQKHVSMVCNFLIKK